MLAETRRDAREDEKEQRQLYEDWWAGRRLVHVETIVLICLTCIVVSNQAASRSNAGN